MELFLKDQYLSDIMDEFADNLVIGANELTSDPGTGKTTAIKQYFGEKVAFCGPMISVGDAIAAVSPEIKSEIYRLEKFSELSDEALDALAERCDVFAFDEIQLINEHDFRIRPMVDAFVRMLKLSKKMKVLTMTGTAWPYPIFGRSNKINVNKESEKRNLEIVRVESSSERGLKTYSKTFSDIAFDASDKGGLVVVIVDSARALRRINKNLIARGKKTELVTGDLYRESMCPVTKKLIETGVVNGEVDIILGTSFLEMAISIEEKVTIISDQCSSRSMIQRFARGRKESRLIAVVGTGTWKFNYPDESFDFSRLYNKTKYANLVNKFKSVLIESYPVEFRDSIARFVRTVNSIIFVKHFSAQTAFAETVVQELSEFYNITDSAEAIKGKALHQKRVSPKAFIGAIRKSQSMESLAAEFDFDIDDVKKMEKRYRDFEANIGKLSDMIQSDTDWIFTKISSVAFDWISQITVEEAEKFKNEFFIVRKAFAPEILKRREIENNIRNQTAAFNKAMVGISGESLERIKENKKIALTALNLKCQEHIDSMKEMSFVFWKLQLSEYLVKDDEIARMYSLLEILLGGYPDRHNMIKIDDSIKAYVAKASWKTGVFNEDKNLQKLLRRKWKDRVELVAEEKFCLRFDITQQTLAELSTKEFNKMRKMYESELKGIL